MVVQLVSDRHYQFPFDAPTMWSVLGATEEYRGWWPWLRKFEAAGLVTGDRWSCTVRPPLPYSVRFTLELVDVQPPARVSAVVHGDITGAADIAIEPDGDGCSVRLMSTLTPASRALGAMAALTRPVVTWGHDWVLDSGATQFARRVEAQVGERGRIQRMNDDRHVQVGDGSIEGTLVEVGGQLERAGWTAVLRDLRPAGAQLQPNTSLRVMTGPDAGATATVHIDQHLDDSAEITGVTALLAG